MKMVAKIRMYQITKELIIEKDGFEDVDSAIVKDQNPNNCKHFVKVINLCGLDENVFKEGSSYAFHPNSLDIVKSIIVNHSEYSGIMRQHPEKRNIQDLNEFIELIQILLDNEVEDDEKRNSYKARVEVISMNERQKLNKKLQSLFMPNFEHTLDFYDEEIFHMYYIEEMIKLNNRMFSIRNIISEIRQEEIIELSFKEVEDMTPEELYKTSNPFHGKVELDRLVIKDLLGPNKKKDTHVQESLENLAKLLRLSEKKLIEELRKFRKENYKNHPLFELVTEDDIFINPHYELPYKVLKKAIQIHTEDQK